MVARHIAVTQAMPATRIACLTLFFAAGLAGLAVAQGPQTASSQKTVADGVYTDAQAARGNDLYQNSCASCHGGALQGEEENPALSGKHFFNRFGGIPVSALYGFINTQMPLGQAGALGAQGNADVTAYILQANKFPAGQK